MHKFQVIMLLFAIVGVAATLAAQAQSSMTAAQVRATLRSAGAFGHANFSGKTLHNLTLDGLDFSGANFRGADLFETSFRTATLAGANFSSANLSAVKFNNAHLRGANLRDTTLLTDAENADMREVNLSGANGYLIATGADLSGANFARARLSPEMQNQPMGQLHTILSQADLTGANLTGTDLTSATLENTKLVRVKAHNTKFTDTDLGNADFTGADLTGADFSGADVAGARFIGIRGRASMRGLASAKNVNEAVFKR